MIDHCKDCGLCCKTMIIEIDHIDVHWSIKQQTR
jgi:hypothetical protein